MKTAKLVFSLFFFSFIIMHVSAKNGELKGNGSLSQEDELELLQDYAPEELSFENTNFEFVEIYNKQGELILAGTITHGEEISNKELRTLLSKSGFLMQINDTSLFIIEQ